jgi:glycosyltransferase involved in cell wall biosynthesis
MESVFLQDLADWTLQLIIVDDGSRDSSAAIAESTAGLFSMPVTVLRQKNGGPSSARNAGVAAARGELIAFLDADDRWLPGKLRAQLEAMEDFPGTALVCCPMNGRKFRSHRRVLPLGFRSLLFTNRIYTSSVLVERSVFLEKGGFDPARRLSEDYELWLKIAAGHRVLAVNVPYLVYTKTGGISSRLWQMERGELETYRRSRKTGMISPLLHATLRSWSIAKYYLRRLSRLPWST